MWSTRVLPMSPMWSEQLSGAQVSAQTQLQLQYVDDQAYIQGQCSITMHCDELQRRKTAHSVSA
jgi:hypothetical protein